MKKLKKEGKTLLLTTHHLEEADELADRIAIMSKGKLLILGTSRYIKKTFGVGYHLIITSKVNKHNEPIIPINKLRNKFEKIVRKIIKDAGVKDE